MLQTHNYLEEFAKVECTNHNKTKHYIYKIKWPLYSVWWLRLASAFLLQIHNFLSCSYSGIGDGDYYYFLLCCCCCFLWFNLKEIMHFVLCTCFEIIRNCHESDIFRAIQHIISLVKELDFDIASLLYDDMKKRRRNKNYNYWNWMKANEVKRLI